MRYLIVATGGMELLRVEEILMQIEANPGSTRTDSHAELAPCPDRCLINVAIIAREAAEHYLHATP